jgi:hypothetical protein
MGYRMPKDSEEDLAGTVPSVGEAPHAMKANTEAAATTKMRLHIAISMTTSGT